MSFCKPCSERGRKTAADLPVGDPPVPMCRWCYRGANGPPQGSTPASNLSAGQITRLVNLQFQKERIMNPSPDFSELIETAERLLHEREQCQQTIADVRKSPRARNPLARAQTQQRLADATLRVNAINEAIRAAKEAFGQPDLLAEVL